MTGIRRCASALVLAAAAVIILSAAGPALASVRWMVKGQDLAPNGSPQQQQIAPGDASIGLAAQAQQDDVTLPAFTWVLCGVWNGVTYGYSEYTTCASGDALVVENYYRLVAAVKAGVFTGTGIHRVVFDIETWTYSGNESQRPAYWITRTIAYAKAYGIGVVVSTGGGLVNCSACWAAAAKAGAAVSVQSQVPPTYAKFTRFLASALAVIRKANSHATIIAGLGTNTPGVHPVTQLQREYAWAVYHRVTAFWLNANNWLLENLCTPAEGGFGCPEIGVQFLKAEMRP